MTDLSSIRLKDRPLVVCDIDEVVLEFISPFQTYLESRDHELRPASFRLTGNVFSRIDGTETAQEAVEAFVQDFFVVQHDWQTPVADAADALERLALEADVVFLTAMPPRHHGIRRALLDVLGMQHPMIASEQSKGPLVRAIHGDRPLPLAFVDDIFTNLHSVKKHAPQALLINLMANQTFRALAPDPGEGIAITDSWPEAERLIRAHFAADARS